MNAAQVASLLFFAILCHAGHALATARAIHGDDSAALPLAPLNATLRVPASPATARAARSRRSCGGPGTAPAGGVAWRPPPRTRSGASVLQVAPKSMEHVHYVGQPAPVACNVSTHRHPWLATFLTMTFLIAIIAAIITCSD